MAGNQAPVAGKLGIEAIAVLNPTVTAADQPLKVVKFGRLIYGKPVAFASVHRSNIEEDDMRSKLQTVAWPEIGDIALIWGRFAADLQAPIGDFTDICDSSDDLGNDWRLLTVRLVPSTAGDMAVIWLGN